MQQVKGEEKGHLRTPPWDRLTTKVPDMLQKEVSDSIRLHLSIIISRVIINNAQIPASPPNPSVPHPQLPASPRPPHLKHRDHVRVRIQDHRLEMRLCPRPGEDDDRLPRNKL